MTAFIASDWYWVVGDTNPTTQVYSTASNAYVANNAAAYSTWLAAGKSGFSTDITAMADNGSGKVRLTVPGGLQLQTNQRWYFEGLDGTPLANGLQQITVINPTTIDITAISFVASTLGTAPVVRGATIIDTDANLRGVIDGVARKTFKESYASFNTGSNIVLSNPPPTLIEVTASASITITLPAGNTTTSIPIGHPFEIRSLTSSFPFTLTVKDNSGATQTVLDAGSAMRGAVKTSNATAAASYSFLRLDKIALTASASDLQTGTLAAARLPQFTGGDVTTSGAGSVNLQIGANTVGNAELAQMAQAKVKLRADGAGTGDPIDGSATDVMDILRTITRFKAGFSTRNLTTASGSVAYTGVGFKPKALLLFGGQIGSGKVGSATITDEALATAGLLVDQAAGVVYSGSGLNALYISNTSLVDYQTAGVASFDSDGFTLTWTKVGSPTGTGDISWVAIR